MTALRFIGRSWTGEDATTATQICGLAMLIAIVWLISTIVSAISSALGVGEPASTILGISGAASYTILGYRHDSAARARRAIDVASRAKATLTIRTLGLEWLLTTQGAVIHADTDGLGQPRHLWRYEDMPGGAVVVGVEVVDSTPDPDGSRRSYFIRVPPAVQDCHSAVAWTFGIRAGDYEPVLET